MPNQTIFLTFDDGVIPGTDDVISVLKNKKIKATLFMVGNTLFSKWRKSQLERAKASAYVEIGNHSYTHANDQYTAYYNQSPNKILKGFQEADEILGLVNKQGNILKGNTFIPARLPGRNTWRINDIRQTDSVNQGDSAAAANTLASSRYRIYGWDLEWNMQAGNPVQTPQQMLEAVIERLNNANTKKKNKLIILMHDQMFRASKGNKEKLLEFIDLLVKEHYNFDFISRY